MTTPDLRELAGAVGVHKWKADGREVLVADSLILAVLCTTHIGGASGDMQVTRAAFIAAANPAAILAILDERDALRAALSVLLASVDGVLVELKPGQSLSPAGAGRTNALESDRNTARRALSITTQKDEEAR